MDKQPDLVKTEYGFWQYHPLPTQEELSVYYGQRYFQEAKGSYAVDYLPEEIEYFRLKARLILHQIKRLKPHGVGQLLDIGCGEGWLMEAFAQAGCKVRGIDYSRYAIDKWHPHLIDYLRQGDIYSLLKQDLQEGNTYDVVVLANVIEHVIDPVGLLDSIKPLLAPGGILLIVAPNDFSSLHDKLLKEGVIPEPFWLGFPDHLSYFNKDSMCQLLSKRGFTLLSVVADNPVDLNLLNQNSNYIVDRSKGKAIHLFRVRADNFLGSLSEDKLLDIYTAYGEMGVGRDLNYYCRIT